MHRGVDGVALATLPAGTTLRAAKTSGTWAEVTLEGWIVAHAVSSTDREGFNLIVTAADGENLRDGPNGRVLARVRKGVLLAKRAERRGWVRVRRIGWVHQPAATIAKTTPMAPKTTAARATSAARPVETGALPQQGVASAAPASAAGKPKPRSSAQSPGAQAQPQSSAQTPAAPGDIPVELAHSAPLYAQPGAGELASLTPGTSGRVLGQSGEWVRVQLEGWVREGDLKPGSGAALVGVTAAEVRANPARYVGQTVEWRVQFISIQTADELRSELPPGEPFLLTRGPLPEPGFIYVVVGRDQLDQFKALPALQELRLRVTIKAARTKYLATPVVELVSVVSGAPGR